MGRAREYPNAVAGLAAAGADALRGAMGAFADWQIRKGGRFDPTLTDPDALAANLIETLEYPEHSFDALPEDAQDRVARAVGVSAAADWAPSEPVPAGTPSYRMPSWEKDVYEVLYLRRVEPPPAPRAEAAPAGDASADWPNLASATAWRGTRNKAAVAKAILARLGAGWSASPPWGDLRLPGVTRDDLGLGFVVVPGGTLRMGLGTQERADAARRAKRLGPEATDHLAALTRACRPVRDVSVAPFVVARTPLLEQHAAVLGVAGDAANAHRVLRAASADAAAALPDGFRLPSEAEWEWVARAGEDATWLSGAQDPAAWAERVLATPLDGDGHPWGVHGLGWGEWLDDGWHPTYRGGPPTSRAWDPMSRPEVVRGGCLALWPWQSGEALLALAAARDRAGSGAAAAVRLARDLPPR